MGQQHGLVRCPCHESHSVCHLCHKLHHVSPMPQVTPCVAYTMSHAMCCTISHPCHELRHELPVPWVVLCVTCTIGWATSHTMCHPHYGWYHLRDCVAEGGISSSLQVPRHAWHCVLPTLCVRTRWVKERKKLTTAKLPVVLCCVAADTSTFLWHRPVHRT